MVEANVWKDAFLATITGFLFSLMVTAVIGLALYFRVPAAVAVEQAGIDFGMRWAAAWYPDSLKGRSRAGFVFVDVDPRACASFEPARPRRCATANPVSATLAAAFVRAAAAGGAAAIVIDVEPSPDAAERLILARALEAAPRPLIIVPVPGRPADPLLGSAVDGVGPVIEYDPDLSPIPGVARANVRLAVFAAATAGPVEDGRVRSSAALASVRLPGGTTVALPTAAYLASRVGDPRSLASLDCTFYRVGCGAVAARPGLGRSTPIAVGRQIPILFRLHSLALAKRASQGGGLRSADMVDRLELKYSGTYRHVFASELLEGRGSFTSDRRYYSNGAGASVVILGSSSPSGFDIHQTPLGPMSGAEVMLNAALSFRGFDHLAPEPAEARGAAALAADVASKVWAAVKATPLLFVAWVSIFSILRRGRGRNGFGRALSRVVAVAIFVAIMILSIALEMRSNASALPARFAEGRAVDFFTPLMALGLEAYADAGSFILEKLKNVSSRAIEPLVAKSMLWYASARLVFRGAGGRIWRGWQQSSFASSLRRPWRARSRRRRRRSTRSERS